MVGFGIEEAERLQRAMALKHGADRAATDVTRVLRIPGFKNEKYVPAFGVTARRLSANVTTPGEFHIDLRVEAVPPVPEAVNRTTTRQDHTSQSERDWAEACRRLAGGEHRDAVKARLQQKRQDKPDPAFYAELTVRKALAYLERRRLANLGLDHS